MFNQEAWYHDGQITWCNDGDDQSHISVVVSHLLGQSLEDWQQWQQRTRNTIFSGLFEDLEQWVLDDHWDGPEFRQLILDSFDALYKKGEISAEWNEDPYGALESFLGPNLQKNRGFQVLLEAYSEKGTVVDPRAWACQHWGWIRLCGNAIQIWRLNNAILRDIEEFLYEVYQEDAEKGSYSIEIAGTGQWVTGVPMELLREGDASCLWGLQCISIQPS